MHMGENLVRPTSSRSDVGNAWFGFYGDSLPAQSARHGPEFLSDKLRSHCSTNLGALYVGYARTGRLLDRAKIQRQNLGAKR